MKRILLVALLAACGPSKGASSSTPVAPAAAAQKTLVNVDAEGVGLGGYDPVAYASVDKPVIGTAEHSAQHGGATYRFSSDANKAAFDAPKHVPAFGGYCAYAASMGRLSPADPLVFEIHEGQLLVFTNTEFRDLFDQDAAGNKAKADAAWPDLVAKHGK